MSKMVPLDAGSPIPQIIIEEWMADLFIAKFGKERWRNLTKPLFPHQEKDRPHFTDEEAKFWMEILDAQEN